MPKKIPTPDVQSLMLTLRGLPDNHEEFEPLTSQFAMSNSEEPCREEITNLMSQFATSSLEKLSNRAIDTDSSQIATSSVRPREARYDFESQLNYIEIGTIMRSRSQNATLKSGQWPNPSFRLNGFPS
jgi:hypothetical protein